MPCEIRHRRMSAELVSGPRRRSRGGVAATFYRTVRPIVTPAHRDALGTQLSGHHGCTPHRRAVVEEEKVARIAYDLGAHIIKIAFPGEERTARLVQELGTLTRGVSFSA